MEIGGARRKTKGEEFSPRPRTNFLEKRRTIFFAKRGKEGAEDENFAEEKRRTNFAKREGRTNFVKPNKATEVRLCRHLPICVKASKRSIGDSFFLSKISVIRYG